MEIEENSQAQAERQLKIYPKYSPRRFNEVRFPEIRLTGKWLQELGFTCGKSVAVVTTKNNKLIISIIEEPPNRAAIM